MKDKRSEEVEEDIHITESTNEGVLISFILSTLLPTKQRSNVVMRGGWLVKNKKTTRNAREKTGHSLA